MAAKLSFLVLFFLLFPATATAADDVFDVTEILSQLPEFRILNALLAKTRLARDINSRKVLTLLAPNNSALSDLMRGSAIPRRALVDLLAVHVVLDYLDGAKLAALPRGRPTMVTTLYQTTGAARARRGFVNVTVTARGGVVFASAAPGAPKNATFEREVASLPYTISVLEVSNVIVPPGIIPRRLPVPPLPPPPPRTRQMSMPPSPAPAPVPRLPPPTRPVATPPKLASPPSALLDWTEAPPPSSSHPRQVVSRRYVVGAACMLGFFLL